MKAHIYISFLILLFTAFAFTHEGQAQDVVVTYDGPTMIDLNEDATSVIVGNPNHAQVVLDNPRRLFINAGQPGMTRLTVLGQNGQVIFNRNIIVGGGSNQMIRIRNACINSGGAACQANRVYYCPEGRRCSDVSLPNAQAGTSTASEIPPAVIAPPAAAGAAVEGE